MVEMKDSGVAWLGEIPKNWKLSKINSIYKLRTQKVSDEDYPPLSVTMKGIVPQLDSAAKTNAHDDRKLVKKGDFAINSRSDRRGSCGVSDYDGSVSLINTVMKPRNEMNPDYYNWLFHTTQFADEFFKWGHGIVADLWTTNWQDMKHIDIPVPTLQEQKLIADYLNKLIPEINSLYSDIEKQIKTLEEYKKSIITEAVTKGLDPTVEMKDSGIEWIGMIPKTWRQCKIKNGCSLIGSGTTPTSGNLEFYEKEDVNWIQSGDIYGKSEINSVSTKISNKALKSNGTLKIYKAPFIVIAMYGGSVGNTAISNIDACTNQACCCVIPHPFIDIKYLFYWINFCKLNFLFKAEGGGQPNISQEKIRNQYLIYPDISEQRSISEYLDKKCSEIDNIISDKKQQLEVLEQYKKSLIYEYVTGKKEVPED